MNYRGTDNAAETDNDDVGFIWKLCHDYSPGSDQPIPTLRKVIP
jgi:hypothetical protein